MSQAKVVTPAKAGVQERWKNLDSGFHRNDGMLVFAFSLLPRLTEWLQHLVSVKSLAAKDCHCERSEAISRHSRANGNPEGASPCAPTLGLLVGPASCRSFRIDRLEACPTVHSSQ